MSSKVFKNEKDEKLYLSSQEYLANDLVFIRDEMGNKKYLRLKLQKNMGPKREGLGLGAGIEDIEGLEESETKSVYPKELMAGFWTRLVAFTLDSLIAGALARILVDGVLNLIGAEISQNLYLPLKTLVFVLYFTLTNLATGGQTLGKMILGLRVVRLDGGNLKKSDILIREFIGRFIHNFSSLGVLYVITAFTKYKQNISDYFADTSVISLDKLALYKKTDL